MSTLSGISGFPVFFAFNIRAARASDLRRFAALRLLLRDADVAISFASPRITPANWIADLRIHSPLNAAVARIFEGFQFPPAIVVVQCPMRSAVSLVNENRL
jgi:hypothetical protein